MRWKRRLLPYPFSLQQVRHRCLDADLQACSDGETQQRNEGIQKSNAIDVVGTSPADQIACDVVTTEKQVEAGGSICGAGAIFLGARAAAFHPTTARYTC